MVIDPETRKERERRLERASLFEAWRKLIPDSRMKTKRLEVMTPLGMAVLIFCINCGRGGGAITTNIPFADYQCPACLERFGPLPLPQIPEELVRPQGGS